MMPAIDGNFSGRLRGLRLPDSYPKRRGHLLRCSCLALYSDAWSIEKNMRKHPRQVNREALC